MTRVVSVARSAGLVVFALCALAVAAPAAHASSSFAFYSDHGDYIGQGVQRLYDDGNATFHVNGNPGDETITVTTPAGDQWDAEFAAPPGQALSRGIYDGAARAPFRAAGQPGIEVSGDGRGCNTIAGRFEVRDVAFDSAGALQRLWVVFEQHCEGDVRASFGELRYGETTADPAMPEAAIVRWPANDFGTPETIVPVDFVSTGSESFGAASLGGDNPGDFAIASDGCAGKTIAAGQRCELQVRYAPGGPGARQALLHVPGAGGRAYDVVLQGFTYGGKTGVTMASDQGDYIGQGKTWSYSPANATIQATGTNNEVHFGVSGFGGDWWTADFQAPQGGLLSAGSSYPGATRYPFNNGGPGLDVGGNGRGCNSVDGSFSVPTATYAADGRVQTFAATFEQHCDGSQAALRGEFDWRAGDQTPLAPWMAGGTGTQESSAIAPAPASPPAAGGATSPASGSGAVVTTEQLATLLTRLGHRLYRDVRHSIRALPMRSRPHRGARSAFRRLVRDSLAAGRAVRRLHVSGSRSRRARTRWLRAASRAHREGAQLERALTLRRRHRARAARVELRHARGSARSAVRWMRRSLAAIR